MVRQLIKLTPKSTNQMPKNSENIRQIEYNFEQQTITLKHNSPPLKTLKAWHKKTDNTLIF